MDQHSKEENNTSDLTSSPSGCGDASENDEKPSGDNSLDIEALDVTPRNEGKAAGVKTSTEETKGIFAEVFSDTESEAGSDR